MSMLNERQKRIHLAAEPESHGRGGMTITSQVSGASKDALAAGKKGLEKYRHPDPGDNRIKNIGIRKDGRRRVRAERGGRKTIGEKQPGIAEALLKHVDKDFYGNPENPL